MLEAKVEELTATVATLVAVNEELRAQLNKNSSNSSKHPEAKRIGAWAVAETERLLRYHRQFRAGELSESALKVRTRVLQARYGRMIDQAIMSGDKKTASPRRELNRQWGEL